MVAVKSAAGPSFSLDYRRNCGRQAMHNWLVLNCVPLPDYHEELEWLVKEPRRGDVDVVGKSRRAGSTRPPRDMKAPITSRTNE